jgi:hypothetical protein
MTLPDLPDLDLVEAWAKLNETITRRLNVSLPDFDSIGGPFGGAGAAGGGVRPGQAAAKRGLRAKHPVVIVPGEARKGGGRG